MKKHAKLACGGERGGNPRATSRRKDNLRGTMDVAFP
jgi:hypothetical protein